MHNAAILEEKLIERGRRLERERLAGLPAKCRERQERCANNGVLSAAQAWQDAGKLIRAALTQEPPDAEPTCRVCDGPLEGAPGPECDDTGCPSRDGSDA